MKMKNFERKLLRTIPSFVESLLLAFKWKNLLRPTLSLK